MTEQRADYIAETDEAMQMLGAGYEPREILSVLSGFTPAPDVLIKKYGFVTALVWGKIWRYCQMADGKCSAGLKRIAGELGMSVRTIIRHIDELCGGDYLKDFTPTLKNKPHTYGDTGKIRIRISIEAAMTQSQSRVTESHRQSDRESLEESIKKQVKKEKIKDRGASAAPKATDFPEVVLFHSVTGRYPSTDTFQIVVGAVQKVKERLNRDVLCNDLLPFWEAWRTKDYRKTNLSWLTDWAVSGIITNGAKHATTPNRQPNAAIDPEQLERDRATAERIKARRAAQQARV